MNAQGERLTQANQRSLRDDSPNSIEFCKHIAGTSKIAAIALVDNYSMKTSNQRIIQEVMLVIHDFQPRLMSY